MPPQAPSVFAPISEDPRVEALHRMCDGQGFDRARLHDLVQSVGVEMPYFGMTPLVRAATFGQQDVAQALLEEGANLHGRDRLSQTPLSAAARAGHTSLVHWLKGQGADPQCLRQVMYWCKRSHPDDATALNAVQVLLEAGASVHASEVCPLYESMEGLPLLYATEWDWFDLIDALLDAGADPAQMCPRHQTCAIEVAQARLHEHQKEHDAWQAEETLQRLNRMQALRSLRGLQASLEDGAEAAHPLCRPRL